MGGCGLFGSGAFVGGWLFDGWSFASLVGLLVVSGYVAAWISVFVTDDFTVLGC